MCYASLKNGGRRFQILAVVLAFLAFDLTYALGMAEAAFKGGITLPAFAFFLFITLMSSAELVPGSRPNTFHPGP